MKGNDLGDGSHLFCHKRRFRAAGPLLPDQPANAILIEKRQYVPRPRHRGVRQRLVERVPALRGLVASGMAIRQIYRGTAQRSTVFNRKSRK
jgi:hypothetical protein